MSQAALKPLLRRKEAESSGLLVVRGAFYEHETVNVAAEPAMFGAHLVRLSADPILDLPKAYRSDRGRFFGALSH